MLWFLFFPVQKEAWQVCRQETKFVNSSLKFGIDCLENFLYFMKNYYETWTYHWVTQQDTLFYAIWYYRLTLLAKCLFCFDDVVRYFRGDRKGQPKVCSKCLLCSEKNASIDVLLVRREWNPVPVLVEGFPFTCKSQPFFHCNAAGIVVKPKIKGNYYKQGGFLCVISIWWSNDPLTSVLRERRSDLWWLWDGCAPENRLTGACSGTSSLLGSLRFLFLDSSVLQSWHSSCMLFFESTDCWPAIILVWLTDR